MATTMTVRPGDWNVYFDVWFRVLPDPLTTAERVPVTVHRHGYDLWFLVQGPNGGVHVQTVAPDTTDQETP